MLTLTKVESRPVERVMGELNARLEEVARKCDSQRLATLYCHSYSSGYIILNVSTVKICDPPPHAETRAERGELDVGWEGGMRNARLKGWM